MTVIAVSAYNFLNLTDLATGQRPAGQIIATASNTLSFSQSAIVLSPIVVKISNTLRLTHSVQKSRIINGISLRSELNLRQIVARPIYASVYQNLQLRHSAVKTAVGTAKNILTLNQLIALTRGYKSTLALQQSVSAKMVYNRAITHTLTLKSFAKAYVKGKPHLVLRPPPVPIAANVTLTDATESIVLPSPEFGNTDSIEHFRINRKTRGGDLKIFREFTWPKTERIRMAFKGVRVAIKDKLLAFLYRNRGRDITLIDYNSISWTVTVIKPEAEITESARRTGCDPRTYDITLEFEGTRL